MPGRAGRNRTRVPFYYWNRIAPTKPGAQALAAELGLDTPAAGHSTTSFKSGILYVVPRFDALIHSLPSLSSISPVFLT